MKEMLSERVKALSESATLKMARLATELKEKGENVISLSLGEPDFDTPDHIKAAAKDALDQGFTKYTPVPGLAELRKAIVHKFKRDNKLDYDVSQIVVSNGAKQTIANICQALLNKGDEVAVITPYWVSYYDIIRVARGIVVPVKAGIETDYKVSAEQLEAAMSNQTKFVLFSSPCNPTGSVYTKEELCAFAEVLKDYPDVLVVSDEIYEYINFSDEHWSIARCEGMKERTVVVNGFSKGYAMTGWRLGYMAAPEWLAKACGKIQSQCTSGANSFGQKAAVTAIMGDMTATRKMAATYERRKNLVKDKLNAIEGVEANDPQGAFYIFPKVSDFFGKSYDGFEVKNADDLAIYLLKYALVSTVSGTPFGSPECIRLSFAASDEQLLEAVSRLEDVLGRLK
jgi:aspartate aminotransferase